MQLAVLADDLTGACDTGALFAGAGPVPVAVWPGAPLAAAVSVLDTESRHLSPAAAADRVRVAAAGLAATRHFKKIDSTLRGHVAMEVDALLRVVPAPGAVLCPAFPSRGRLVLDGALLVDGEPVAESPVAHHPDFPRGASPATSRVVDLLRPDAGHPLMSVLLPLVRAGVSRLAARLAELAGTLAVCDAATDTDLDTLAAAALALEPAPLLVGAAGLGAALARQLGLLAEPPPLPAGPRWLIVAGSRHPASRRQVLEARRAGLRVLATPDEAVADRARVTRELATRACECLARERFDVIAITGGETLAALFHALHGERIDLVGPPLPGLAFGHLRAPAHPALPILTKAGGFGPPDLFVSLVREAVA
jgi:D-threonate/D-erythronate kinase